ncbi:MAG: hypothetical protein Q7J25_09190 [Vicinamibacterales bacterium]|nr:hypothetical protein [Vicinamibacterales bacterium]
MQGPGAIVVDVIKQPPITRELGMADVVLGAVGLTGAIMIGAVVTGLVIGVAVVGTKMIRERRSGSASP